MSVGKAVSVTARVLVGTGLSVGAVVATAMGGSVAVGWGAPQAANSSKNTRLSKRKQLFNFISVLLRFKLI